MFPFTFVLAALRMAGARGSRTHRPDRRAGTIGFEVRGTHRSASAPTPLDCWNFSSSASQSVSAALLHHPSILFASARFFSRTFQSSPIQSSHFRGRDSGRYYLRRLYSMKSVMIVSTSSHQRLPRMRPLGTSNTIQPST